jgi:hypothetical protein
VAIYDAKRDLAKEPFYLLAPGQRFDMATRTVR